MKDARDGDLSRKISLINGSRLHTFEYRLADHGSLLQYTNIRCILMLFDPTNPKPSVESLSLKVKDMVPADSVYELYNVIWLILKEEPQKAKFMQLAEDDEVSELILETEFMTKVMTVLPKVRVHQILLSEAEINEIEGLPTELTEMTMVISVKVAAVIDEIIEISDDSVVIISDDE